MLAGPMALLSLNVVIIANIFVVIVLADNAAERSAVAYWSTSIAVTIARLPQRRKNSPINIESPDFAGIHPMDLGARHDVSKE